MKHLYHRISVKNLSRKITLYLEFFTYLCTITLNVIGYGIACVGYVPYLQNKNKSENNNYEYIIKAINCLSFFAVLKLCFQHSHYVIELILLR